MLLTYGKQGRRMAPFNMSIRVFSCVRGLQVHCQLTRNREVTGSRPQQVERCIRQRVHRQRGGGRPSCRVNRRHIRALQPQI